MDPGVLVVLSHPWDLLGPKEDKKYLDCFSVLSLLTLGGAGGPVLSGPSGP